MTEEEKLSMVQGLVGNVSDATSSVITPLLARAKANIFNRLYPFGRPSTVTEIPEQYEMTQVELAMRYFNRMGAEGEITHNENGINRSYDSANDADVLDEVMQIVRL